MRVLLVRHFRYPVGTFLWDIPGGMIEPSESPADCALRELLEETGYNAQRAEHLIDFYPEPAFADHAISIFRTVVLPAPSAIRSKDPEVDRVEFYDLTDEPRLIHDGMVRSSWTVIGLLTALASPRKAESEIRA